MISRELENCVQALAAEGEEQLTLFPPDTCKGDELVLDFEERYGREKESALSEEERRNLQKLDDLLGGFSGKDHEDLYRDEEALLSDPRWEEIRKKARITLRELGIRRRAPAKNGAFYATGNGVIENR